MYEEKPYDFVGFPAKPPQREEGVGQDRIRSNLLTGTLTLTMQTMTPVHVGSGYSDFVKAGNQEYLAALQASKKVCEPDAIRRRYLIPGSSIKGAVRSIVEAITYSCVRVTQGRNRSFLPQGYGGCIQPDELCPACRLFGAQDYQGHLSFEDAIAPKGSLVLIGTPLLWTPARSGRGLPPRYLEEGQAKGRKFYRMPKMPQGLTHALVSKQAQNCRCASILPILPRPSWACCLLRLVCTTNIHSPSSWAAANQWGWAQFESNP